MYGRRRDFFKSRRRAGVGRWIALILVSMVVLCGIYTVYDNSRIVVKTQRVLVSSLPKELEGFTVLHISDLNAKRFGSGQSGIERALKNKKYSAVCITGDMVGARGDAYPFYELLTALNPDKPVFFIAGNTDPTAISNQASGYTSVLADWVVGAQTRGATFLGPPASITVGGATVWFTDAAQLSLDLDTAASAYASANSSVGAHQMDVIAQTKNARWLMKPEDLHITLSSKPLSGDLIQGAAQASGDNFVRSTDLILAGGTSGGQWTLPFAGPVWSDGWFPQAELMEGYCYTGGMLQYISGGLGISANSPLPRFRFFNSPSVTLLTFTSEMSQNVLPDTLL